MFLVAGVRLEVVRRVVFSSLVLLVCGGVVAVYGVCGGPVS